MKAGKYKLINNACLHCSAVRQLLLIMMLGMTMASCSSASPKKPEVVVPVAAVAKIEPQSMVSQAASAEFEEAMSLIKSEQLDKAAEILKRVQGETPKNAVASINLALIYRKQGKLKEAEESLKQALVAEPENPVAHNEYGLLYRKTGRFKEARQMYEGILAIYPNYKMVHRNLGILCDLYMRDYECALTHYVIYSSADPEDKAVKIWIADLQKRLGK